MLKKWNVTLPELTGDQERRAYIYLPDYYEIDESRRYPVMYMFDGHNVFVDEDATYGKSWGMNKFMNWTKKPLIIVAVECNHEGNYRLREYAPLITRIMSTARSTASEKTTWNGWSTN